LTRWESLSSAAARRRMPVSGVEARVVGGLYVVVRRAGDHNSPVHSSAHRPPRGLGLAVGRSIHPARQRPIPEAIQPARQRRVRLLKRLPERLLEQRAVQHRIQHKVQVEVEVEIQAKTPVTTPVRIRPDVRRDILRDTQGAFRQASRSATRGAL
jgi:hypothetical protein